MKIGIDARMWSESGVGRYIRNLVLKLSEVDSENEYYLFLLKKNLGQILPNNFKQIEVDFGWYGISEQVKFPGVLNKYRLDLVHFPHFNVPVFYKGKFVVTIHDLIHQKFEMRRATTRDPFVYKIKQFGYKKVFSNALKKSDKIIVPSSYVKNELMDLWKVEDKKINVTYEGVDEKILNLKNQISKQKALEIVSELKVKLPFVFYVGNAHPHKNVEGLIKAFLRGKEKGERGKDWKLVLAGNDHYFWQRIRKQYQVLSIKYQEDILFLGNVSDEQLVALYKTASVFVMPSFEEGFGIPILEAMAVGCVVASSFAGSLKEVGGDGAIYFDPKDINDMEQKIERAINDQKLRRQLIEKGDKRYKEFSWGKLTNKTLNIYKSVIS